MNSHLLFIILGLALTSVAFSFPKSTALPMLSADPNVKSATANITLFHGTFDLGLSHSREHVLFCNGSSATTIDHKNMSHLVNKPYASKSKYFLLLSQSGYISKHICNCDTYDVPISIAENNVVDGILNDNCGDLGGRLVFPEWHLWIGRDATNDDGSFRWACGPQPLPER
ncbi:hypothetical protein N8I77_000100 [Diaporthe amygdali]|uniref:Uncharacterized protein n=1 Tax=Phomopsis amygdali TaxID=1214568 RepID=A0AAD9W802_PHOAM|nr:hypothetical protein N8I77_000100 [Diaporthe amygdali]